MSNEDRGGKEVSYQSQAYPYGILVDHVEKIIYHGSEEDCSEKAVNWCPEGPATRESFGFDEAEQQEWVANVFGYIQMYPTYALVDAGGTSEAVLEQRSKSATKRPSWDQYYLDLANTVSTRATCPRLSVGCVIVKDNKIVSTGYNGSIHGHDHCTDVGCLLKDNRCIRTVHAEANAILHARREDLVGATLYCTHECCHLCTKEINQAGITRVVFRNAYVNEWNQHFIGSMEWVHIGKVKEEELET